MKCAHTHEFPIRILSAHFEMTSGIVQFGHCTVHVDSEAVRSCVMPAEAAAGKSVVANEGLHPTNGHPRPNAFIMVIERRTPAAVCRQFLDPEHNRNLDADNIVKHVTNDPLVLWG